MCLSILVPQCLFADNRGTDPAVSALGAIVFSIIAGIVIWVKNQFNKNDNKK